MGVIAGRYEMLSDPADQALDEFLIALGISGPYREAGQMVKPTIEVAGSGETWTMKTLSELADEEVSFTIGQKVPTRFVGEVDASSVFSMPANDRLVQTFT